MKIDFRLERYQEIIEKLNRLSALNTTIVDPTFRKWLQYVRKQLKKRGYPAQTPGQRYKRTRRLGNSWGTGKRRKAGEWMIDNIANRNGNYYAGYVVGPKSGAKGLRQAWMHRNRWWRADEVIANEYMPELVRQLDEAIQNEWRS